ncbi:MAG: sigma-70 family RNA polymerase sigma factor [Clostridia bacterium]|nr:sigma-70 family RNA polymerase sigma factor [Clostridia bacterium]
MDFEEDLKSVIDKYEKLIFKLSLDITRSKEESENIVQETFFSYYNHRDEYLRLDDISKKRLLARIAINKAKDYLKSSYAKKREGLDNEEIINLEVSNINLEESLIKREKEEMIRKALDELNEPYKSLIKDYYFDDYNLDELSRKNNSSKGTIKVQLTRAKEKLKLILGGEAHDK